MRYAKLRNALLRHEWLIYLRSGRLFRNQIRELNKARSVFCDSMTLCS
jgi:hypothetical protein